MTPAQREAVARKLREQHLGVDAALAHCSAEELSAYLARADELIAAYEAARARPIAEVTQQQKHCERLLLHGSEGWVIGWWETGREFPGSGHFNDWCSGLEPNEAGFTRVYRVTHFAPLPKDPAHD